MTMYGCFSAAAAELYGSSEYRRQDGTIIEVTGVYADELCERDGHEDKILLGEVTEYVGEARQGICDVWEDKDYDGCDDLE